MLTCIRYLPVFRLQADLSFRQPLPFPQMHYFGNHVDLGAYSGRAQIRAVQISANMARIPKPVTTNGCDGC